jgi:hypothetical protein
VCGVGHPERANFLPGAQPSVRPKFRSPSIIARNGPRVAKPVFDLSRCRPAPHGPAGERSGNGFLSHRRRVLGGRRGHFDHLLGNGNQAPQGLNVQACLTPDGLGLRAVVPVSPA